MRLAMTLTWHCVRRRRRCISRSNSICIHTGTWGQQTICTRLVNSARRCSQDWIPIKVPGRLRSRCATLIESRNTALLFHVEIRHRARKASRACTCSELAMAVSSKILYVYVLLRCRADAEIRCVACTVQAAPMMAVKCRHAAIEKRSGYRAKPSSWYKGWRSWVKCRLLSHVGVFIVHDDFGHRWYSSVHAPSTESHLVYRAARVCRMGFLWD